MKTTIALFIALASAASPLAAQDVVKFKDPKKNPSLEGEVVDLSFKAVQLKIRGVEQKIEASLIADLIPSNDRKGPDFTRGEEAMANGDFATAIQRFERVV